MSVKPPDRSHDLSNIRTSFSKSFMFILINIDSRINTEYPLLKMLGCLAFGFEEVREEDAVDVEMRKTVFSLE